MCGCRNGDPPPWLIGHVTDLGTPAGESARRGIQLAVEETNADPTGRVNGRKFAVIHADTAGRGGAEVGQLMRLGAVNKVEAVLAGGSIAELKQLGPTVKTYGLVMIGTGEVGELDDHRRQPGGDDRIVLTSPPATAGEALTKFHEAYRKKFNAEADTVAIRWYDAARFLLDAVRQTKTFDGRKWREALAKTKAAHDAPTATIVAVEVGPDVWATITVVPGK